MECTPHFFFFRSFFLLISTLTHLSSSRNVEILLSLKSSIDPLGVLKWPPSPGSNNVCQWEGVKQCLNGTITKLVIERLNLNGTLDPISLNHLDQLRVLSFKQNSLHGQIPQLLGLKNLKSLFLQDNDFSGSIPYTLASMHRLKVIDLSGNKLSGHIPQSLTSLTRLLLLYLENNQLSGAIPPLNQTSLKFFNVSNNKLYGKIPTTTSLLKFNSMSFVGNIDLCGRQVHNPCPIIPSYPNPILPTTMEAHHHHHRHLNEKLILILVLSGSGIVISLMVVGIWIARSTKTRTNKRGTTADHEERPCSNVGSGFCWEQGGEEIGNLVFLDEQMSYSLEDLLKASAETLGRGIIGSTYKAVMETGYIVTVKRLRDSRYPCVEEFRRHVEILGKLRHHNLVPLRAYFQAEEERLLVYDYFPNGSLFTLIHGSRRGVGGRCKPLHWTACLKISEDLATGLSYIHHHGLTHGNLKSTNVLLGQDFESCLTDYGLSSSPHQQVEVTQRGDVYSFGVLLLELLTGKSPPHDVELEGWVRSVWGEESTTDQSGSSNEGREDKLGALLKIAVTCISSDTRPRMKEVLRMVREARAEAHLSSSSNNSPGRWWDAVQSWPREQHLSM